jgi:hypothetical protein
LASLKRGDHDGLSGFPLRIAVDTATAATIATGMATAATASRAIAASVASSATGQSYFLGERWWPGIFLIEDIERRQADIGDFLLTEKYFVTL